MSIASLLDRARAAKGSVAFAAAAEKVHFGAKCSLTFTVLKLKPLPALRGRPMARQFWPLFRLGRLTLLKAPAGR